MNDIEGQVVIVTGAGRPHGVGRATATQFARLGARVIITDLDGQANPTSVARDIDGTKPDLFDVARDLEAQGIDVEAVPCDVSDETQVKALVKAAVDRFGRLDSMFTNAAILADRRIDPLTLDADIFDRVLSVNLRGTFLCARTAARQMIEQGTGGSIVTVGSRASRRGNPSLPAYSASKFGVIGLTQSLAMSFAPQGIRVNCVCPGSVDTDMTMPDWRNLADVEGTDIESAKEKVSTGVPLGRLTSPTDVANAIVWFASSAAAHVTGQSLNVNGGTWLN